MQEEDLKQSKAVSLSWGDTGETSEAKAAGICGDPEGETVERKISKNVYGVPLSMLLKHMIKFHKGSQKKMME